MSPILSYVLKIIQHNSSVKSLFSDFGELSAEYIEHSSLKSWVMLKTVSELDSCALAINVLSKDTVSVHFFLCDTPPIILNQQFQDIAKTKQGFSMSTLLQSTLSSQLEIQLSRYDFVEVSLNDTEGRLQHKLAV